MHKSKMLQKPTTVTNVGTVLLIDDDIELCGMLQKYLGHHGWQVCVAHTGRTGIEAARESVADLIVLDIMLPDFDGFEVLRQLRRQMDVPVLFLTARGEEVDCIVGLELGADDYLAKPFGPRELLARMRAVARRSVLREPQDTELRFTAGGFTVNGATREIAFANHVLNLTSIEYALLRLMLSRPHEVLSREELVKQVFERPFRPLDRSLDMHILRLRRKLDALPGFDGGIKTVRSSGYTLVLDPLLARGDL